ncbi:hypothetical protein JHK85_020936 [Glycine max]|nr:hypothetical protein JHK85_020936 [Glycine max]
MGILKIMINAPISFQWTNPDVCKWRHVTCDSSKRVTAIQIGSQNLQGSLPKELVKLTSLERFECQFNSLTGPFPYLSKSLQKLVIHDNKFSFIPNDFFKGMSHLQEVRIDDNPFSQWHIHDTLRDCVALHTFSAQSVGLVGTIPNFFGKDGPFPGLVLLALSDNFLEGALPTSLSDSSIENLLVNGQNSLSKLNGTLVVLQNMKSLRQIWANGNSFTGPIPDLSHHDQLSDVNLRDNQLTGVVPPSLISLPSLKFVNLTNNFLQGSSPIFKYGVGVDNSMDKGKNQYCTDVPGQPCSPLVNSLLSIVEPMGYPLKFAQNWQGNDPCANKWTGIICSGGNISVINFQNMGLSGTICPCFAKFTSVTKLLLANNGFIGTIPNELTSLPLLQELDVSNNHLYGKVPLFRKDVVLKLAGNPDIVDAETLVNINIVAELAGHCCAREPYQRPDMSHVVNVLSPLVEVWKPSETNVDDIYGIDYDMTLPEALQRWKDFEGSSTTLELTSPSSSVLLNGNNTKPALLNLRFCFSLPLMLQVQKLAERMLRWLKDAGYIFFRESCFHQSGDSKRKYNPTHYREPRFYTKVFKECHMSDNTGSSCKCIGVYVRNKKNQNQDRVEYSYKSILRSERMYGPGFVSTGGLETTKEFVTKLGLKPGQKVLDVWLWWCWGR